MYRTYINKLTLVSSGEEFNFIRGQKRTCYNGIYPYKIFPEKELRHIEFAPITIFYGSNGSGKCASPIAWQMLLLTASVKMWCLLMTMKSTLLLRLSLKPVPSSMDGSAVWAEVFV